MRYNNFASVIGVPRMSRYLAACGNDTRKAMTLYRKNLSLSQELFTVISCFEIALRNKIDTHYQARLSVDWLWDSVQPGGMFDTNRCRFTKNEIINAMGNIGSHNHNKLVAELGFGFWRYMLAANQFGAAGRTLLQIFPSKPSSTPLLQYNNIFIFNTLADTNKLRNRIAHHEPVCFRANQQVIDTTYVRTEYHQIMALFQWMGIDEQDLLYGLDHVLATCDAIDLM